VNDLLEFSRLRRGRERERTFARVNLAEIVEETIKFASKTAERKLVTLARELAADLPRVTEDRDEIVRLFTNLADNAIRCNREAGSVAVTGNERVRCVCIGVRDAELGIPRKRLGSIRETCYRVKMREARFGCCCPWRALRPEQREVRRPLRNGRRSDGGRELE
jgi:two-component system phosphate regulon sensor histidine kinase PhoR